MNVTRKDSRHIPGIILDISHAFSLLSSWQLQKVTVVLLSSKDIFELCIHKLLII